MSTAHAGRQAAWMIHDDRGPRPAFRVLGVQISVQLVLMLLSFVLVASLIVLSLADWVGL